jgi:hypothetical protein
MDTMALLGLLAQVRNGPGGADAEAADAIANLVVVVIELVLLVLIVAGMWGIFVKAGEPGWAAIIPIYNNYVLLRITGKPEWWLIPMILCPCINIIFVIMVNAELATRFGKGGGYALGLIFLPFIFFPLLGFGDARYRRPGSRYEDDYEDQYEDRPRDRLPPDDRIQGDRGGYR